jgi:hypothetical protein
MKVISVEEALQKDRRLHLKFAEREEPVYCVQKKSQKKKKISYRALTDNNSRFWAVEGQWSFFLLEPSVDEALEELREEDRNKQFGASKRRDTIMSLEGDSGGNGDGADSEEYIQEEVNFSDEYEHIRSLSTEEKCELISTETDRLSEVLADPHRSIEEVGEVLNESTRDATLSNKAVLEEALKLGDAEAKDLTRDLVQRTQLMVKNSTSLINETVLHDDLLNLIVEKSNGTVVQHMTRTYLRTVSFLLYYNNKLLNTSFANKVRARFPKTYRDYYWKLLPHFHKEDVILERVFQSGIQAVSQDQVQNFAAGFLIHDVGKAKDIKYHEGTEAYDREKIVDHVRQGYLAIMHKTDYPPQAGLIAGYHHEYYGHSSGYGFHRAFYQRQKKKNPKLTPGYCISYTVQGILTFQALSYFPAKILEIIDVYDALTDPNRIYRKPLSREEALELMQEQFINENLKLDPVLFDIYKEYLYSQGGTG